MMIPFAALFALSSPSDPRSGSGGSQGAKMHQPALGEVIAQLEGLRALVLVKFDGLKAIMDERDARYTERDVSAKEAVRAALSVAKEAAIKTEEALTEYKAGANEWRDTVKDLIADLREKSTGHTGESIGKHAMWGYLVGGAGLSLAVVSLLKLLGKL